MMKDNQDIPFIFKTIPPTHHSPLAIKITTAEISQQSQHFPPIQHFVCSSKRTPPNAAK
jgi:hypothetical protein